MCLILSIMPLLTACSTQPKYVERYHTVKVPVPCKTPDVTCDVERATYTEKIGALLECIQNYKEANAVCKN